MNEKPGMFQTAGQALKYVLLWMIISLSSLLAMGWVVANADKIDNLFK